MAGSFVKLQWAKAGYGGGTPGAGIDASPLDVAMVVASMAGWKRQE